MAALDAQGSIITIEDAVASPVVIGEVKSYSGFDGEADENEVTNMASLAKEFRQGLQDFGNFSIEVSKDPDDAGQNEVLSARSLQSTRVFVLTLASGDVATFSAFVKSSSLDAAIGGIIASSINIRISGAVVWT